MPGHVLHYVATPRSLRKIEVADSSADSVSFAGDATVRFSSH
jgi:hypothetical protein